MKKLSILLVLFIFAAGFIFAQNGQPQDEEAVEEKREIEIFNLELGLGFPVHWTNGRHTGDFYQVNVGTEPYTLQDKFVTANTSFNAAAVFNFTKILGLTLEFDIFFGAKLTGFSNPSSDHNSLFGLNAFIGPVFYLFNNGVLRIPLSIGAHMYYFADDLWISDYYNDGTVSNGAWFTRTDLQFGPAVALGVQFHFDNGIYIFSRTQVSIDFVRMHTINTDNISDQAISERNHTDIITNSINWGVRPSFGIGIKN